MKQILFFITFLMCFSINVAMENDQNSTSLKEEAKRSVWDDCKQQLLCDCALYILQKHEECPLQPLKGNWCKLEFENLQQKKIFSDTPHRSWTMTHQAIFANDAQSGEIQFYLPVPDMATYDEFYPELRWNKSGNLICAQLNDGSWLSWNISRIDSMKNYLENVILRSQKELLEKIYKNCIHRGSFKSNQEKYCLTESDQLVFDNLRTTTVGLLIYSMVAKIVKQF